MISDYLKNLGWLSIANLSKLTIEEAKIHIPKLSKKIENLIDPENISPQLFQAVKFYNQNKSYLV